MACSYFFEIQWLIKVSKFPKHLFLNCIAQKTDEMFDKILASLHRAHFWGDGVSSENIFEIYWPLVRKCITRDIFETLGVQTANCKAKSIWVLMYSQIRQSSFLSDLSKIVERGASSAICYCVGIRGNYLALVSVSQSDWERNCRTLWLH